MDKPLEIEFVSDFVCPWCYLGKRRLEAALAQRPDLPAVLHWRPFQLSPDMPREGRNRQAHYAEIFGPGRAAVIIGTMQQTGSEEGIHFCNTSDAMSPNTLSAHVLMHWAAQDPAVDADDLAERLFHAHHVECRDIGNHDVLVQLAREVGMDGDAVAMRLAEGADEPDVSRNIAGSAARGVSGVPFMIINGKFALSGAQPPDVLIGAFEQILASA